MSSSRTTPGVGLAPTPTVQEDDLLEVRSRRAPRASERRTPFNRSPYPTRSSQDHVIRFSATPPNVEEDILDFSTIMQRGREQRQARHAQRRAQREADFQARLALEDDSPTSRALHATWENITTARRNLLANFGEELRAVSPTSPTTFATPKVSPQKYSAKSSSPVKPSNEYLTCQRKLSNYPDAEPYAKPYLRKLLHICEATSMKCENPGSILAHLRKKYSKNTKLYSFTITHTGDRFSEMYNYWLSLEEKDKKRQGFLHGLMTHSIYRSPRFDISVVGLEDHGAGVVRDTFTKAVDDMIAKIFMKADNDVKANRYVLKPDADENMCRFAGELIAFCLLNEIPIRYKFSRSMLIRMIYKETEVDEDIDVMYVITDFTQTSQVVANMLSFPSIVDEDFDANPNESYEKLKSDIRKRARALATSKALTALTKGFFLRNEARKHSWTVDRLDQLLSGSIVDKTQTNALIDMLKKKTPPPKVFIEMLELLLAAEDYAFIENIMMFWTGMRKIDLTADPSYTVIEIGRKGSLPLAQTCFNILKIPADAKTPEELLARFKKAEEMGMFNFGLD